MVVPAAKMDVSQRFKSKYKYISIYFPSPNQFFRSDLMGERWWVCILAI